ncbi:site-specific integrase [Nocardia brasiliensis]|uniref:site-specific integrase n=1 Tax=Nocardia brasiliensis TaxID=37326 RepID=UPI0024574152|nr:site-specific integrase [Nocardia brasiliensis]
MKGHVYQRGSTWSYRFRIPGSKDPVTGKYEWATGSGYPTKREADKACRDAIREVEAGRWVKPSNKTVAEFLTEWLPLIKLSVDATTFANWQFFAKTYVIPATVGRMDADKLIGNDALQKLSAPRLLGFYGELLAAGRIKADTNTPMFRYWSQRTRRGETVTPREVSEACGTTIHAARSAVRRYKSGRVPVEQPPGLAPKTVRNIHIMLHRALADAKAWKYIADNPATGIKPPKLRRRKRPVWNPVQLSAFMDHIHADRFAALFMLEITTGMRRAELCGLRWPTVDLDAGTLSPQDTLVVVDGRAVSKEDGKTENADRLIALDPGTVAELRAWKTYQDSERASFGNDHLTTDRVFTWQDGRDVHPDSIRERFKRLAAAAGLPEIRFYDLRHSYVTGALQGGVRVEVISERIGHASVAFTLSTYNHVTPGMDREAALQGANHLLAHRSPRTPDLG